ncbi:MAG: tetratricopeptide repeat protein [Alphaproteobacteria bacterium]
MVRRLLTILFPLLALGAGALWAQSEAVNLYLDRGRALSKADKIDQALPYFLFALELGEKEFGPDSPSMLPLLNDLAQVYATRDDYGDAEPLFERSLKIQEGEMTRYRSGIARTLNQLGAIYEATARPNQAREAYTRVLANLQAGLGVGDPSVQTARLRLAKLERLPAPPTIAAVPLAPAPSAPTASAPTIVAAPRAATPGAAAGYHVHLSSVRRIGRAPDEWRRLRQMYPVLLGGLDLAVVRIDLGIGRGIWFRVLGGPLDRAAARRRCDGFTRRGIWCAVRRGPGTPVAAPAATRVADEKPPASTQKDAAPKAATPSVAATDYRIHLTSVRREANAAAEWRRLQRLFRAPLADLDLSVMRADLGEERGVWYRIQGGPLARAEARARCASFAARQHWCRVVPPPGHSSDGGQRFVALRVRRRGPGGTRGTWRPRPASVVEPGARREQS